MKRNLFKPIAGGICLAATLTIGAGTATAAPGAIVGPVSAVINSGGPGDEPIAVTYNQGGLSVGYTSGVTDFDTYVASAPTHTFAFSGAEWFSEPGAASTTVVTYDFGSVINIDRLALWNENVAGIAQLDLLAAGEDMIFTEFATDLVPTDNPSVTDYLADVFAFSPVSARYVRFNITDSYDINGPEIANVGIGEVAFRTTALQTDVPEASTWAAGGVLAALVGGQWLRRRRA